MEQREKQKSEGTLLFHVSVSCLSGVKFQHENH